MSLIDILMPQMGESIAEGTIVRWLKRPGDAVARDEPLVEISTDKVDTEVPAPAAGVLREILVGEGATVGVGTPVARLDASGRPDSAGSPVDLRHERATVIQRSAEPTADAPAATQSTDAGHFRAGHAAALVSFPRRPADHAAETRAAASLSPAVLETTRQSGISIGELISIRGSGRGGRISKRDVEQYLAARGSSGSPGAHAGRAATGPARGARPGATAVTGISLDRGAGLPASHATAFAECQMTVASAMLARHRDRFAAAVGAPLTYAVLVARAAVAALAEFPALNASTATTALAERPEVNLGVVMTFDDAADPVVPVVRGANELSLAGLARAVHDLAARARADRLRPEDLEDATFTLTDLGEHGGVTGTPVVSAPQVAMLGMGAVTRRPVAVGDDDRIAVRPMMWLSLTFDHRAAGNRDAFRFLQRVGALLATCDTLLGPG